MGLGAVGVETVRTTVGVEVAGTKAGVEAVGELAAGVARVALDRAAVDHPHVRLQRDHHRHGQYS